jgi:ATP-dependent DNA helicase RecG
VRTLRGGEDTYLELKVRFSNVEKLTAEIIALANTAGGAMVFGVNDQLRVEGVEDPEAVEMDLRDICANQIQPPVFPYINKMAFDSGRRVVILEVGTDGRPHRTLDDRFFIREGSTKREATREELSLLMRESRLTGFEHVPVFDADLECDIDESLFWSYVRGVNPGYWGESTKGFPTDSVLRDMGLVVKFEDELFLTVGGLLLFGLNDRVANLAPQASVRITRYSGDDHNAPVIEQSILQGNLFRLFDGVLSFIARYIDLWDTRPSRKAREQKPEDDSFVQGRAGYHRGVILETLTNSLVHRDWSERAREARINIYDDSVEFVNPSQPIELPTISLRYGVTAPHNPRLKAIFTNQHYGLQTARGGVPMICSEATTFARRSPEGLSGGNGEFRVKIYGLR